MRGCGGGSAAGAFVVILGALCISNHSRDKATIEYVNAYIEAANRYMADTNRDGSLSYPEARIFERELVYDQDKEIVFVARKIDGNKRVPVEEITGIKPREGEINFIEFGDEVEDLYDKNGNKIPIEQRLEWLRAYKPQK